VDYFWRAANDNWLYILKFYLHLTIRDGGFLVQPTLSTYLSWCSHWRDVVFYIG